MKLLAFDTSTETMSIALQHGDAIFSHTGVGGAQASLQLIPQIESLMAQAGLSYAQLDGIVFGRGPGSFTGLRTACSVAQGLALGANIPVLPVDTLRAVAMEAVLQGCTAKRLLCALDARMDEVYAAHYEIDSAPRSIYAGDEAKTLQKPEVLRWRSAWPAAWLSQLTDGSADASPEVLPDAPRWTQAVQLAGNLRPTLDAQLPPVLLNLPHLYALPTARALLALAPSSIASGGWLDASQALPLYVRDKVALTTAERLAR
jgi:tRNA threonylcarbamoyladenosine biosynthesis protein TsaB